MINGCTQRGKTRSLLRVACLLTALLLGTFWGYAQESTVKVTGKVVDESNMPIPGASIVIKGTTVGVATDIDGAFTLNVPVGATLRFSFIGYLTQERQINGAENLTVVLPNDVQEMEEVVVTGFGGVQKTKTLTASVAPVPVAALQKLPLTSISSGLGGRVTGVITQERSGMPGEVAKIWIRGGSDVLYVIDDVVMETEQGEIFFNRLRPDDIENMTILKDASATAVYGPRARDGVVVVTTKKGAMGSVDITVSQKVSIMTPSYKVKSMSIYDYALWRNEVAQANYVQTPPYSQEQLSKFYLGELYKKGVSYADMVGRVNAAHGTNYTLQNIQDMFDPNVSVGDNIQDYYTYHDLWDLFDHVQPMSQTNVSVRGGSEKLRYYSSLGYMKQKGVHKNFDFEQVNFLLNTEASLLNDKSLRLIMNLNGNTTMQKMPAIGENVFREVVFWGNGGTKSLDNKWSTGLLRPNSPQAYMETGFNNTRQYRAQGTAGLKWNLPWVEGLTLTGTVNVSVSYNMNKQFNHPQLNVYETPVSSKPNTYNSANANLYQYWSDYLLTTGQVQADYGKKIKKHNFFVMLNYTSQVRHTNFTSAKREDYATIFTPQISSGAKTTATTGGETKWGSASWVGRLNYDYDSRYILSYAANYNGSLSYSPDKRWGFFNAVSFAWVLSEEKFFKEVISPEWVSMFKLRYGYGTVGREIGAPFSYLNSYSQRGGRLLIGNSLSPQVAWYESNVANDLTWSSSRQMTGGVDFGFFKDRLTGSVDLFLYKNRGDAMNMSEKEIRTDILGMPNVPQINAPYETSRKGGVEFSFRWEDKLSNNFRYYVGLNYTFWDERVTRHTDEDSYYYYYEMNGLGKRAMNPVYDVTYQTADKLIGSWEEVYNSQIMSIGTSYQNYVPGTMRWTDPSGSGRLDAGDYINGNFPGDTPLKMYGINLGGSWKGFELDMFFQGAADVRGTIVSPIRNAEAWFWNYGKVVAQHSYSPSHPDVKAPLALANGNVNIGNIPVDRYAFDASYFKMKSLSLRYNFMETVLKDNQFFKALELSFTATNLFTVTKKSYPYKNLADPEFVTNSVNMYGGNGNLGGYPTQRGFTFGLTATF